MAIARKGERKIITGTKSVREKQEGICDNKRAFVKHLAFGRGNTIIFLFFFLWETV